MRARAWADVSLDAIAANVETLRAACAPSEVCAVVKADGYGHGAVPVARAALDGGATWLAVAQVAEAAELRAAGVAAPILLLSEPPLADVEDAIAAGVVLTAYTEPLIQRLGSVARRGSLPVPVHLKVDTGMHRVGAAPDAVVRLAELLQAEPLLSFDGMWTHCAVADEPDDPYTKDQLRRFDDALATLAEIPPAVHAANSAGALAHPDARRSFVRAGIAMYGISPGPDVDHLCRDLRPVMSLKARVSFVKRLEAGDRLSYGLRHAFDRPSTVATVPIGYHDGVRRALFPGQTVLLGGRRRPIVGVVTMDQLMIDCGDDAVAVGDEVVLLGRQGGDEIRAEDWAARLGTIGYEITCGINPRVPRLIVGGQPAPPPRRSGLS